MGSIQCQCGNLLKVTLHYSINVRINPELKQKTLKRKINNYYCEKCGAKSELAYQFLYVDYNYDEWIWCYPEGMRNEEAKIREKMQNSPSTKLLNSLGTGTKQTVVFGYDEFVKKITFYDSKFKKIKK